MVSPTLLLPNLFLFSSTPNHRRYTTNHKTNLIPVPTHCHRRQCPNSLRLSADQQQQQQQQQQQPTQPSRWQRRTAKRRQRTERLLDFLESLDEGRSRLPSDESSFDTTAPAAATTASTDSATTTPSTSVIHHDEPVPALHIPPRYKIHWNAIHPEFDPVRGGNIRGTSSQAKERGERKRLQVEAFHYVLSTLLEINDGIDINDGRSSADVTIVDAACGAGNLSIGLAGLWSSQNKNREENEDDSDIRRGRHIHILAVDINPRALQSLEQRVRRSPLFDPPTNTGNEHSHAVTLTALHADLADSRDVLSAIPPRSRVVVTSLHGCGAASDMAVELALECGAPFVVCPCCTAKSLTRRDNVRGEGNEEPYSKEEAKASFRRSGAMSDIVYPRSEWLTRELSMFSRVAGDPDNKHFHYSNVLSSTEEDNAHDHYALLAKIADVGLGPQTPSRQREHRRRAKRIVEWDRLRSASERGGYEVRLVRVDGPLHDPMAYGKGDILLGAKRESAEADVLMRI